MPQRLEAYGVVVFDCDGVILNSNALKSDAMGRALDGQPPELVRDFVAYHKANGGVSRYRKYRHFYTVMHKTPDAERHIREAIDRYATLIHDGLRSCAEVEGIRDLLGRLHAHGIPCIVNSGGDQAEVSAALADRGLARFFARIYGSPATKEENLARVRAEAPTAAGLYFGDAGSDLAAAEAFGFEFVFVSQHSEWDEGVRVCNERGIPIVATLAQVLAIEPSAP